MKRQLYIPEQIFLLIRNEDETFPSTEIWIAETDTQELADLEEESTAQELEARMIGQRIQEIVGQAPVLDKKTGEYRPAQYRDCVILLRTVAGWAETFVSVLMDMGIPVMPPLRPDISARRKW